MKRLAVLLAIGALFCPRALRAEERYAPPPTKEQIEADWLRQDDVRVQSPLTGANVSREEDAAGGVDGIKDGKWGFHTADEANPWWQVDLGTVTKLDRIVLFNRCDGTAARAANVQVLVGPDEKNFRQVAQGDGTVFGGQPDGKPLVLKLDGAEGRIVRLTLPGKSYFHLDEVEIDATGSDQNIALGKPATQSSTSTWSARHAKPGTERPRVYPFAKIVARGVELAKNLQKQGVPVIDAIDQLNRISTESAAIPADASDTARRELYFRAHWIIRRLALSNPLLDFDSVLFVKRAPTLFPHMSDQYYGWWSRPGGGLYVLDGFKSDQPHVRCLTSNLPPGDVLGPDLSYDGRKALFAWCQYDPTIAAKLKQDKSQLSANLFHHVFELDLRTGARRQLTTGKYDDFDPRYLPGGDILFLSTRKGLALECSAAYADSTRSADLPDSYVRCGGDAHRPVPVFTLHAVHPDGSGIRPLSAFENFEYMPSVASDGRILYTRWDYIDRFNGNFFSLWSANQDGTNPQLVYGNYTVRPQVKGEARSIPGSTKLIMTAAAHHSTTGGSLCLLDRTRGTEEGAPLTQLTPDVVFPETGGSPSHYYANPWPLSEDFFLVAWSDRPLPPHSQISDERQNPSNAMGIYLFDAFGNQELLYRDPNLTSAYPIPVRPRPVPPAQASLVNWDGPHEGRFLLQDVYTGLENVPRGAIRRLRIVGVPPKVQPNMNTPTLGISAEDPGKFVLGTVPVEEDGSAHFRAPSGVPVFFQALDADGVAVQTMRTLTYVMPNETLGCVGCHEHREDAPPSTKALPIAARREPSSLTPGPEGSWPLSFAKLVQPVLDKSCTSCHQPNANDVTARQLDLRAANAYQSLMSFQNKDLEAKAKERDRSIAGQGVAATSKLWALLNAPGGHHGAHLDSDARDRLLTWMDTYAQRQGHYADTQEREIEAFRAKLAHLLDNRKP